jgi:hypothetical protein
VGPRAMGEPCNSGSPIPHANTVSPCPRPTDVCKRVRDLSFLHTQCVLQHWPVIIINGAMTSHLALPPWSCQSPYYASVTTCGCQHTPVAHHVMPLACPSGFKGLNPEPKLVWLLRCQFPFAAASWCPAWTCPALRRISHPDLPQPQSQHAKAKHDSCMTDVGAQMPHVDVLSTAACVPFRRPLTPTCNPSAVGL